MKTLLEKVMVCSLFILISVGTLQAQNRISGTVSDINGEPLIGVSVTIKGTSTGTATDIDGKYQLSVPDANSILEFSYIGFGAQEIPVGGNSIVDIQLSEDIAKLDEVVVTGLASSIKRSNLANAISTVSAEELTGVTSQQTLDGALYGKLTGVNINANNGAPGGGIAMRLRGVSSLSGNNQPLWIVDGVYISNAEIPSGARFASGANSGSEEGASNRIADLNPDDIESIEILKGASAAAIYGTRANAGVVIVTTKAGKSGKTQISLNQDLGFNSIIKFVGRRQYTAAEVGEAFGEEEQDKFEAAQAAGKIFDYEREIYGETGFIRDTKLKISGGNDKTNFFVSGSIRDEDGIIKNTGYVRNSLRLNLKHKITDDLDIQINANYVNSSASRSFTGNENEGGLSYGYTLAFTRDWVDLFPDADGNYSFNPNYAGNPIFVRDNARNEETTNRLITGVKLGWTIAKSDNSIVKFVANGGGDFFLNETEVYVPENHQSQIGTNNGFIGAGRNKFNNTNFQAFGIWDYFADSGISFSSQVGVSYLNFDRNFLYNQTTQLIPLQTNLSQGGTQEISQTIQTEEEFGFIAQEEINFKDRIIATVGVRFDKSSLNGDPNKYYAFPRASLAVNLGNFDFWNSGLIDQLKFRVAYGQTGSSAAFGSLFTSLAPVNIGGSAGFSINPQQGNPNLEPEKSSELEFGADVTFKGGKIGLEATYYIRNVNDLLYDRSLPTSSGFSNEIRNDLDLRNTGLELALKLKPISTTNLTWNTGFNFWFNRSEVTRLGVPGFVPPGVAFGLGLGTFFVEQDNPITALWGRDDEGNPTITGDTEPDFQLGWFNEVGIGKDLDFNFLVHWKEGGDVLNLTRLLTDIGGQTPQDIADIEGFIEDASYIRLREIGLYYTIPKTIKGLSKIKLGVSARNLLTITDYSSYDPETSTKGGSGLSTGIEVTPFPSSKQVYFHIGLDF